MQKLKRLVVLSIMTVLLFVIMYCVIPLIVVLFGGDFLAVAQHPMYAVFAIIINTIILGRGLYNCFDGDYISK